jgi:excisionase family DNA binding protein
MALGYEKDWCSSQQAADRLGLTPWTLYRLIDHGQLAAYRFGRVIRLQRREVEDYITACKVVPGTLGHLHRVPPSAAPDDVPAPTTDEDEPPVPPDSDE